MTGLGYTYADTATATLIHDLLAEVVRGRDAMGVPGAWSAMVAAIRNLGRPGIASMAISAVDAALWDLKARLLDLPLVTLLGAVPRPCAGVRQRRVHVVFDRASSASSSAAGSAAGIPRVKMKIGRASGRRSRARPGRPRGDRARGRAVRRRQRRLQPQAGPGHGRAVRRAGRDLVRGAGLLRRPRRPAPAPRPGPGGHGHRRGRVWLRPASISAGCSRPAPSTCCRRTRRAAAGSPGSCASAPCAKPRALPLSAHCAPSLHAPPGLRPADLPPPGVLPRPRPDRAHALRRRPVPRSTGRCVPTCAGPGLGLEFKRQDAARYAI